MKAQLARGCCTCETHAMTTQRLTSDHMSLIQIIALPFLALALLIGRATAADLDDGPTTAIADFPMPWRVYCDPAAGVSFRYPYELMPKVQDTGDLYGSHPVTVTMTDGQGHTQPGKMLAMDDAPGVHAFSLGKEELKTYGPNPDLNAIAAKIAGDLTWTSYDYYHADPARPFAAATWALPDITALIGDGGDGGGRCGILVRHGDWVSGVILLGKLATGDNQRIIDGFEVMATGQHYHSGEKLPKSAKFLTWAESQCRAGKVTDSNGKMVPARDTPAVDWKSANQFETQHYHITGDVSPRVLVNHGAYLEALFRAYTRFYQPDSMPPYKFEVHIFTSYEEFQSASAAWGNAIHVGPGDVIGGFFVPHLLSLWVYEDSGKVGGPMMSIEHVMAHECSHQFLHLALGGSDNVPTWLNEGLAVYFESGTFQGGEFRIRSPAERIELLREMYDRQGSTLWPLDKYLDHHGQISAAQYGEVFAMTSFWLFGTCTPDPENCPHRNCGLSRFRLYWQALKKHEDGAKAFERIFMADMIAARGGREEAIATWESLLLEYVKTKLH